MFLPSVVESTPSVHYCHVTGGRQINFFKNQGLLVNLTATTLHLALGWSNFIDPWSIGSHLH